MITPWTWTRRGIGIGIDANLRRTTWSSTLSLSNAWSGQMEEENKMNFCKEELLDSSSDFCICDQNVMMFFLK